MTTTDIAGSNLAKDLGVWIDNGLTFSDHIAKISCSANRLIGLFKRTYVCITPDIFKIIYKIFIRPKLEYASVVWSPYLKSDILRLENIQRRENIARRSFFKPKLIRIIAAYRISRRAPTVMFVTDVPHLSRNTSLCREQPDREPVNLVTRIRGT